MMRQPHTGETIRFRKHDVEKKLLINAVDYDLGHNTKAYFDKDTANYWVSQGPRGGNKGHVYRNDGVDIKQDSTAQNSYFVSHFENSEWLQYTIDVVKTGNYNLELLVAIDGSPATLSITVNESKPDQKIEIAGNASGWKSYKIPGVRLTAGKNKLRITMQHGETKIREIRFATIKTGKKK